MRKWQLLAILGLALSSGSAHAQTFAIYVDTPAGLSSSFEVTGEPFSVVTVLEAAGQSLNAVEWMQTELGLVSPGVLKVSSTTINCGSCDPANNHAIGLYIELAGGCLEVTPQFRLATIQYVDLANYIGPDTLMEVTGLPPGGSWPSSFGGAPGYMDCSFELVVGAVQGGPALITGSGVVVPSGALVLNPVPVVAVEAQDESITTLKSVFR